MVERFGVMMIETDEVVMHIYERDAIGRFVLFSSQRYPLPPSDIVASENGLGIGLNEGRMPYSI